MEHKIRTTFLHIIALNIVRSTIYRNNTILCDKEYDEYCYFNSDLSCKNNIGSCNITCNGDHSCSSSIIKCGEFNDCDINCNGLHSCDYTNIICGKDNQCHINCIGSCDEATLYCPQNNDCTISLGSSKTNIRCPINGDCMLKLNSGTFQSVINCPQNGNCLITNKGNGEDHIVCPINGNCNIWCGLNSCKNSFFVGPETGELFVTCSAALSCAALQIDATDSTKLTISGCFESNACVNMIIKCPPNINGEKRCHILAQKGFRSDLEQIGGTHGLVFYAVNAWRDIDFDAYFGILFGVDGTMYCTSDYSISCEISNTSWQCMDELSICNDPPYEECEYELVTQIYNWYDAEVYCRSQYDKHNGHLISIHSDKEAETAQKICASLTATGNETNCCCWIGVHDFVSEGMYVWSDGSEYNYSNWYENREISSNLETMDCAVVTGWTSKWFDRECVTTINIGGFICQYGCNKEPSTLFPTYYVTETTEPTEQPTVSTDYTIVSTFNGTNQSMKNSVIDEQSTSQGTVYIENDETQSEKMSTKFSMLEILMMIMIGLLLLILFIVMVMVCCYMFKCCRKQKVYDSSNEKIINSKQQNKNIHNYSHVINDQDNQVFDNLNKYEYNGEGKDENKMQIELMNVNIENNNIKENSSDEDSAEQLYAIPKHKITAPGQDESFMKNDKELQLKLIQDWFAKNIKLYDLNEVYSNLFVVNGYDNMDIIAEMSMNDLKQIGIEKTGHQKHIFMQIQKLKHTIT